MMGPWPPPVFSLNSEVKREALRGISSLKANVFNEQAPLGDWFKSWRYDVFQAKEFGGYRFSRDEKLAFPLIASLAAVLALTFLVFKCIRTQRSTDASNWSKRRLAWEEEDTSDDMCKAMDASWDAAYMVSSPRHVNRRIGK